MKKVLILLIIVSVILSGCSKSNHNQKSTDDNFETTFTDEEIKEFESLLSKGNEETVYEGDIDSNYTEILSGLLYEGLDESLNNDQDDLYEIESINTQYLSKEYLEELAYNSKSNILFGYSVDDIERMTDGQKYVFTLDNNNETSIEIFESTKDTTFRKTLLNLAKGGGVILIDVIATKAGGLVFHTVFACNALTVLKVSAGVGAAGFIIGALITGIQTNDINEALKKGVYYGSEAFKWTSYIGVAADLTQDLLELMAHSPRNWRDSELKVLDRYGGKEQIPYFQGRIDETKPSGCSIPDIVRTLKDGTIEAIEVKNYKLDSARQLKQLADKLYKQVSSRVKNLPAGSLQRIVLDLGGKKYDLNYVEKIIKFLQYVLKDVYPNIPIDVLW